jgi:ketosteroid isomerase-like protein
VTSEPSTLIRHFKREKEDATAEAAVRQRAADGVEAVRAKDIDAVMATCASNIDSFDTGPPLR